MDSMSLGPFVTCLLTSLVLTVYLHYILDKSQSIFKYHAKIIYFFLALTMIRMFLPINFPFTYSIYGTKVMNAVGKVMYFDLTKNMDIFDFSLRVWLLGAIIQIIRYFIQRIRVRKSLIPYILSPEELEKSAFNFLHDVSGVKKIQLACVEEEITPSIFGVVHPIIILPKDDFDSDDLEFIIRHEIQHYHNYDLHFKMVIDLLVAIHWWNPFVYGLRKKFNVALELSNDYMVSKGMTEERKIEYAESLLRVAKKKVLSNRYDLALIDGAYLEKRICFLMDKNCITASKKRVSMILNVLFITIIMFISLLFVPEAEYTYDEYPGEEGTFSISAENAYFLKGSDGYKLYVDGEYVVTLEEMSDVLKEVPVYEEKNR